MTEKCKVCKSNDGKFFEEGYKYKGKVIHFVCGKCSVKYSDKLVKL